MSFGFNITKIGCSYRTSFLCCSHSSIVLTCDQSSSQALRCSLRRTDFCWSSSRGTSRLPSSRSPFSSLEWFGSASAIFPMLSLSHSALYLQLFFFLATLVAFVVPNKHRGLWFSIALVAAIASSLSVIQGFLVWPMGAILHTLVPTLGTQSPVGSWHLDSRDGGYARGLPSGISRIGLRHCALLGQWFAGSSRFDGSEFSCRTRRSHTWGSTLRRSRSQQFWPVRSCRSRVCWRLRHSL